MTWGLTEHGYVAPRTADFLTIIRDSLAAALSDAMGQEITVDWSRDVFLGNVTAIMAARLGEIGEATQALVDAFDPENAQEYALDTLCLLVGVRRRPATRGTISVHVTGTPGTVIPAGRMISIAGVRWTLAQDTEIGVSGTGDGLFTAATPGRIHVPAGPAQIVTPTDGWTGAEVLLPDAVGQDRETDSELRRRRQQSLQTAGSGSHNALIGALLALEFVEAAVVLDNDTAAPATIGGVSLDPHSVAIIIHPSTLTDEQIARVALTIYGHGLFGTRTMGSDAVASIRDRAGGRKVIRFDFATQQPVSVEVSLTLATGYALGDVEGAVSDQIRDYFAALGVGDAVRRLALLALVSTVPGVVGAEITLNGAPSDVLLELSEIATLQGDPVIS